MKKFNTTVESNNGKSSHCFSFLATDILSAVERLKKLNLDVISITELPENFSGKIRVPEDMY